MSKYSSIKDRIENQMARIKVFNPDSDEYDVLADSYAYITQLETLITHCFPDKFPVLFITGVSSETDSETGMPRRIQICPEYGVDFAYNYELKK